MNSFDDTEFKIFDQEGNVLEFEVFELENKVFSKVNEEEEDYSATFFEDDPFFYDETEVEPKFENLPVIEKEYDRYLESNINPTKKHPDDESDRPEGGDPKTEGEDPNTEGEDPNTKAESPSTGGEDPNTEGEVPNTGGEDPNTEGEVPNTEEEVPNTEGESTSVPLNPPVGIFENAVEEEEEEEKEKPSDYFVGSEFLTSFKPLDGKYYSIRIKIKDDSVKNSRFIIETKSNSFDLLTLLKNFLIALAIILGVAFVFFIIFVFYINFLNKKSMVAHKNQKNIKSGVKNYNPYFLVEDKKNSLNLALEHKRASKFGKLPNYNDPKDFCKCCKSQKYVRKFKFNDKLKDIAKSSPIISFYFLFLFFSIIMLSLNFLILCIYELAQGINLEYCFLNCKLNLPLNDLNQYDKVNLNLFIKQNRDLRDAFKNSIFLALTILNFFTLYIGKYLFFFYIRNYYQKIDDDIITPSDFAIKIKNIEKQETEEIMKNKLEKYFFEIIGEDIKIEKIIYIYDVNDYENIIDKIKNINVKPKKHQDIKELKQELEKKLKELKEKKVDLKNKIILDKSKFIGSVYNFQE